MGDPSEPDFKVQNLGLNPDMADRLDDREHLLKGLDRLRRDVDNSGTMDSMDKFNQRAIEMLTSDKLAQRLSTCRASRKKCHAMAITASASAP